MLPRMQVLGELLAGGPSIGVIGTHGKTTTSSMIAVALVGAGLDPSAFVGGIVPEFGANARTGTIRLTLISGPARIASSARRLTLHLPRNWPWETAWNTLFHSLFGRNRPLLA